MGGKFHLPDCVRKSEKFRLVLNFGGKAVYWDLSHYVRVADYTDRILALAMLSEATGSNMFGG